jgi:hypothetical protein
MNAQEGKSKSFLFKALNILVTFIVIACIGFIILHAVKYVVDFLLLLLLVFAIAVGIVLFFRMFIWLFCLVAFIVIVFCGIAILGNFGRII